MGVSAFQNSIDGNLISKAPVKKNPKPYTDLNLVLGVGKELDLSGLDVSAKAIRQEAVYQVNPKGILNVDLPSYVVKTDFTIDVNQYQINRPQYNSIKNKKHSGYKKYGKKK